MFHILLVMIDIIFWIFRVVVAVTYNMGTSIGFEPLNFTFEIIVLFVTLFCLILVAKRKLLGGILYLITYGAYFGVDLYNKLSAIIDGQAGITDYSSLFISFIAILLAFLTFASIGITGKGKTTDGKTDWFFKNNDIQRQRDSRDDTNQYKF